MTSLLIPTDFSDNAMNALDYACHLSALSKAPLSLLNVHRAPVLEAGATESQTETDASDEAELNQALEAFVHRYESDDRSRGLHDLQISLECRFGAVADSIAKEATNAGADMIVMGTKGATNREDAALGSMTNQVLRQVNCPVLAIPAGCRYQAPKRIVYALDLLDDDMTGLYAVLFWSRLFKAETLVLHIKEDDGILDSSAHDRFNAIYDRLENEDKVQFEFLLSDDIPGSLDRFMRDHDAQWLAMATRRSRLLGKAYDRSLARKMMYHSKVPLLAIPSGTA